jgi:DNA-binding LacI/PurR family transcriptional regulator
VLINRLNHPFYSTLVEGIAEEAHVSGTDLLIHQSGAHGWSLDRIARQARERAVDGIIVGTGRDDGQLLSLVGTVPMVSCDGALESPECPRVFIDHFASTLAGLEHLGEQGARSILAVSGSEFEHVCSSDHHRRRAFEAFQGRRGAPELLTLALRDKGIGDESMLAGSRLFEHIRHELPRVDAVFAASDEIAAGLITAARAAGVAIPKELRVLGFDDQPIAEALGISTISQPTRQMGREAMSMLAGLLDGESPAGLKRELEYRLVVRMTT